jgi:hypothetical protein
VSWITLAEECGRATVAVDVEALRALVSAGGVQSGDEFIFEVMGRANPIRLWTAVPLECFLFTPSKIFAASETARSTSPALGLSIDVHPPELLADGVARLRSLMAAQVTQLAAQTDQLAIQAAQMAAHAAEIEALDAEIQAQTMVYQTHLAEQDALNTKYQAELDHLEQAKPLRSEGRTTPPPRHGVDHFSAFLGSHAAAPLPLALPIAGLDESDDSDDDDLLASLGLA